MTFSQFKNELKKVRDNRRQIRSILKELETLKDDRLANLNSGAIDYSKERVQTSPDPDARIINGIDKIDRDISALLDKVENLRDANRYYEELIMAENGTGGEVVRLFTIEGMAMPVVANHLNYACSHCWKLWKETVRRLYEISESRIPCIPGGESRIDWDSLDGGEPYE